MNRIGLALLLSPTTQSRCDGGARLLSADLRLAYGHTPLQTLNR